MERETEPVTAFIDEPIEVDYDRVRLGPTAFTWRGVRYEVAEILETRQDYHTPEYAAHARGWLHRRHRNYYTVRTADGQVWELYLDRAGGRRQWVLLKKKG